VRGGGGRGQGGEMTQTMHAHKRIKKNKRSKNSTISSSAFHVSVKGIYWKIKQVKERQVK
jgi:hypothetical protein